MAAHVRGTRGDVVGVKCDVEVAAAERRGGTECGTWLGSKPALVHKDVDYDLVVDTTSLSPEELADVVIAWSDRLTDDSGHNSRSGTSARHNGQSVTRSCAKAC